MRKTRFILAFTALALAIPAAVDAQQVFTVRPARIGILTEPVPANTMNARERVVVEVVTGSAAERAGVTAGDTIIRFNGLPALQQVMSAPFQPGDTIVLRVRRTGREREVRVIAEAAPQRIALTLPDSVVGRMSIIMDRVREQIDTISFPSMHIQRLPGDSGMIFRMEGDTTRIFQIDGDNKIIRFGDGEVLHLDSMRLDLMRSFEHLPGMLADSLFMFRPAESRTVYGYGRTMVDTLVMRPGQIFETGFTVGMRAVAGAELAEMNPGLSEYFGTAEGVLVLNAREGTPAATAGLRAGDVITHANGHDVRSILELRRAMGNTGPSEAVRVTVLRRGERKELTLPRR